MMMMMMMMMMMYLTCDGDATGLSQTNNKRNIQKKETIIQIIVE